MANRTTVKSNVNTKIVPVMVTSVHRDVLNNDFADNLVFREDVAIVQSSSVSNITVDFTDRDRIDLTRTGGSLNITVSGLDDGDRKFLLITKTSGQVITWVGVTDVTPMVDNVDDLSTVLYEIVRKSSNYYAKAYAVTSEIASVAECNALSDETKVVTPGRIPISSTTQRGVLEIATQSETAAGTSNNQAVSPFGLEYITDGLRTKIIDIGDWNMDTDASTTVSHGLADFKNIREMQAIVRDDFDLNRYDLGGMSSVFNIDGGITSANSTQVTLRRRASGQFDNTSFDSSSYNRGWLVIRYLP